MALHPAGTAGSFCPNSGLIAHWKLNESTGATTAADSAGSNDGTLTNMDPATDWVAGKLGNALDFDGTNDQVMVTNNPALVPGANDFSVAAWMKSTMAGEGTILSQMQCATIGQHKWQFGMWNNGYPHIRLGDSDENKDVATPSGGYNDGQWHHVAATMDRDGVATIYVDGVAKNTISLATLGAINNTHNCDVYIGGVTDCITIVGWNGQLDDI